MTDPMTDPTTPRPDPVTEAGRALLDHEMGDRDVPGNDLNLSADEVRAAIIAIEQEAAALALVRAFCSPLSLPPLSLATHNGATAAAAAVRRGFGALFLLLLPKSIGQRSIRPLLQVLGGLV